MSVDNSESVSSVRWRSFFSELRCEFDVSLCSFRIASTLALRLLMALLASSTRLWTCVAISVAFAFASLWRFVCSALIFAASASRACSAAFIASWRASTSLCRASAAELRAWSVRSLAFLRVSASSFWSWLTAWPNRFAAELEVAAAVSSMLRSSFATACSSCERNVCRVFSSLSVSNLLVSPSSLRMSCAMSCRRFVAASTALRSASSVASVPRVSTP
mmetsp:Transcript_56041/g.97831  ORF Transcript_56041/g.97831 Transcript_56041/m.97831 type:complete len:219 (+) Transcript_56041:941-1597(+)